MNDAPLHDPELRTLEARLSASAPRISPDEQQQVLYRCAFAAGRAAARKHLRRWQAGAALLVVALVGVNLPRLNDVRPIAKPATIPVHQPEETSSTALAALESFLWPVPAASDLDAWRLPDPDSTSLADELAQLERTDDHTRSLAAGTMMRAMLKN